MRVGDNTGLAQSIETEARIDPLRRMKLIDEAGVEHQIDGFDTSDDEETFVVHISRVKDCG